MAKVLAGLGKGRKLNFGMFGIVSIDRGFKGSVLLNKSTVENYQVLDQDSRKSVVSAVGRAFVGGLIIGPVGWLAGLSAKNKSNIIVEIIFKDGEESLVQVDGKEYAKLLKALY
jgi:hypothetical protein